MKYIDDDKLIVEVKKRIARLNTATTDFKEGRRAELRSLYDFITSLQQKRAENIIIPEWCLKDIENTLRIQNNINLDKKSGETCQDRNIRCALNQIRKLLNGEELTGMERLEQLQEHPEVELEKEINLFWDRCIKHKNERGGNVIWSNKIEVEALARHFYELGLNESK